jgi:hypothetical protein
VDYKYIQTTSPLKQIEYISKHLQCFFFLPHFVNKNSGIKQIITLNPSKLVKQSLSVLPELHNFFSVGNNEICPQSRIALLKSFSAM